MNNPHYPLATMALIAALASCDSTATAPASSSATAAPTAVGSQAADSAAGADSAAATRAKPAVHVVEARGIIKRFATALKKELMAGMNAGGPTKAVAACNERAPAVAAELKLDAGWSIRRTSLKLRNPDNAPDDWERKMLTQFEKEKADGKPVAEIEAHELVDGQFRFMKAIGTGAQCLSCHGSDVTSGVAAALDARYPKDDARGFAVGDIRGAFSLRKTLSQYLDGPGAP